MGVFVGTDGKPMLGSDGRPVMEDQFENEPGPPKTLRAGGMSAEAEAAFNAKTAEMIRARAERQLRRAVG